MDLREPRVRRRGFFLHSAETNEPEVGEQENPEGFAVRIRTTRRSSTRPVSNGRSRGASGRQENTNPQIRSGSVTGSRQRSGSSR